jgi:type II secretory pathway pseudopilin PulG
MAQNLLPKDRPVHVVRRDAGAPMRNEKKEFTLLECVIVVAILLFVAGIAAQKLVHSLKASEENTLHDAATQYLDVKNMYVEQSHSASTVTVSMDSANAESIFHQPGH